MNDANGGIGALDARLDKREVRGVTEPKVVEPLGLGPADIARSGAARRIGILMVPNQRLPVFVAGPPAPLLPGLAAWCRPCQSAVAIEKMRLIPESRVSPAMSLLRSFRSVVPRHRDGGQGLRPAAWHECERAVELGRFCRLGLHRPIDSAQRRIA